MAISAFYNGTWVSCPANEFAIMQGQGEAMLKSALRQGKNIQDIISMTKLYLDEMKTKLVGHSGRAVDVWGDAKKEKTTQWIAGIHILLRLNAIKNDRANGWAIKHHNLHFGC